MKSFYHLLSASSPQNFLNYTIIFYLANINMLFSVVSLAVAIFALPGVQAGPSATKVVMVSRASSKFPAKSDMSDFIISLG